MFSVSRHLWHRAAPALLSVVLAVAWGGGAGAQEEKPAPKLSLDTKAHPSETLSRSGQFLAHGPSQPGRATLVTRAEEIREEFIRLIEREEKTIDPATFAQNAEAPPLVIDLWLRGDAQPPVQPRLYRLEGLPQPTIGLIVAREEETDSPEFRRELTRLLLVERIVRGHLDKDLTTRASLLPPWLATGVLEAMDYHRAGQPSGRFASLFSSGQIMPVEEILTARPGSFDSAQRDIFAASSCSLVLALLEQPQGPARFRQFLGGILSSDMGFQNQLVRAFPGLALSRHSLEKWWSLQLAAMAQPGLLEPLTASRTEELLAQALMVRYQPPAEKKDAPSAVGRFFKNILPGGKKNAIPAVQAPAPGSAAAETPAAESIPLTDIARLKALPDREKWLARNQLALADLSVRAFPMHRPLLDDYQRVIGLLIKGKTKGLEEQLAHLAAQRREIIIASSRVEDLLNWHEATQRQRLSGSFDRYFQLLDELEKPPPRRANDPISRTLDELEEEFSSR